MKYIVKESHLYFIRRGVDLRDYLHKTMEKVNPCKYKKINNYVSYLFERVMFKIMDREDIRNEVLNDESYGEKMENSLKEYFIEQIDFIYSYYNIKCNK